MAAEEERTWLRMHSAEAIVEQLVQRDFPYLGDAHIWCLGRPKASKTRGRVVWAKAKKPSPELQAVADDAGHVIDYLIVIGQDQWDVLTTRQREALIFHELCHFAGFDHEAGTWDLRAHDVEAFAREVEKYGAWKTDLQMFFETIKGTQPDLWLRADNPIESQSR